MTDLNTLFANLKQRNPNQEPFHQAVEEVFMSLDPFFGKKSEIHPAKPAGTHRRTRTRRDVPRNLAGR